MLGASQSGRLLPLREKADRPKAETDEGTPPNRDVGSPTRTRTFAKTLRHRQTDAERKLWGILRDRRFARFKFRRQVPLGPYIADFVSFEASLVVEIDGSQHAESTHDALRDRWLHDDGYRVLRFWNNDLTLRRQGVLDAIWNAVQVARPSSALRAPSPARGEGLTARSAE